MRFRNPASLNTHIVDKPGFPQCRRCQKPDRPRLTRRERRQSLRMARFNVIDGEPSRGDSLSGAFESGLDRNPFIDLNRALAKRRIKGGRGGALFFRQIDITRRQREAILLAHRGDTNNPRFEIEIAAIRSTTFSC